MEQNNKNSMNIANFILFSLSLSPHIREFNENSVWLLSLFFLGGHLNIQMEQNPYTIHFMYETRFSSSVPKISFFLFFLSQSQWKNKITTKWMKEQTNERTKRTLCSTFLIYQWMNIIDLYLCHHPKKKIAASLCAQNTSALASFLLLFCSLSCFFSCTDTGGIVPNINQCVFRSVWMTNSWT